MENKEKEKEEKGKGYVQRNPFFGRVFQPCVQY